MERQKAAARPRRLCVCGLCVCGDGEAAAQVSIFFSDIRGFTALSESLPPSVCPSPPPPPPFSMGPPLAFRFLPQPRGFERPLPSGLSLSKRPTRRRRASEEMRRFLPQPRGFKSRPCRSRNTPQELIELLGDYLESMSALIEESRGTVGKYIGDAIMVRPGATPPAPVRAPRGGIVALEGRKAFGVCVLTVSRWPVAHGSSHMLPPMEGHGRPVA